MPGKGHGKIYMVMMKLKQIQSEADTWKRSLAFVMDENAQLKFRLSEIMKEAPELLSLDELEMFQNRFIEEDRFIAYVRNDLREFDRLLVRETFEDGKLYRKLTVHQKSLRKTMKHAEKDFSKLKTDFHVFVMETLEE